MVWSENLRSEVLTKEFQAYPASYYRAALASGKITVDEKQVSADYVLKDHDFIAHRIHRHEPPVLDTHIDVIEENEEVLVVEKPASIPIHTTGKYRHNTLLKTLEREHSRKLYTCHRLDRLTSGIIVLLKNTEKAKQYGALFRDQKVSKTYLALCSGEFPSAGLSCSGPILQVSHKFGINKVDHEHGKAAHTTFTRIHFDTVSGKSLVLCKPRTGKMHQIRVHLAHNGFPISNDPIYSRENWAKKSTAEFSEELTEALFRTDNVTHFIGQVKASNGSLTDNRSEESGNLNSSDSSLSEANKVYPPAEVPTDSTTSKPAEVSTPSLLSTHGEEPNLENSLPHHSTNSSSQSTNSSPHKTIISGDGLKTASEISVTPEGDFLLDGRVHKRIPQLSYEAGCPECSWTRLVPKREDMFLYLHAVRYELDGQVYSSKLPEWCPEDWIPETFRELLSLDPRLES